MARLISSDNTGKKSTSAVTKLKLASKQTGHTSSNLAKAVTNSSKIARTTYNKELADMKVNRTTTAQSVNKLSNSKRLENKASKRSSTRVDFDPTAVELSLHRISPISAAKVGFFTSLALGVIMVVAVSVFWLLLDASGIFFQFTQAMLSSGLGIDVSGIFSVAKVSVVLTVVAAINTVLFTVVSAIFAAIYNAVATLTGGIKLYFTRT